MKFITTTLPYANSAPHVGSLLEFLIGDALSRFYKNKLGHKNVLLNVGLDCHGLKIEQAAKKAELTPQKYIDYWSDRWTEFCEKFDIKYDTFYKTSSQEHIQNAQKFWNKAVENGDIYKKKYKGLYCIGCESFKVDSDLEYGRCPDHSNLELQPIEEENYFFRLSKYKEQLSVWIKSYPEFLVPSKKTQELLNIIDAIEDISVSRQKNSVSWAVPVPNDATQTIYVWMEALTHYVFSAGYNPDCNEEQLIEFNENKWAGALQTCGVDNLRFQAVIFQAILISAGIKNTHRLLVHGTILDANGKKMSKTVDNVIDPVDQLVKYGINAVRYYTLAGLNLCENSSWDESRLVEIFNSHLANNYGNLLARVLHLVDLANIKVDYELIKAGLFYRAITERIAKIHSLWEELNINEALAQTNELVTDGNKKIDADKPWGKEANKDMATLSLIELHYLLNEVAKLYYPVIPAKSEEAQQALLQNKKYILFKKLEKTKNDQA